MCKYFTYTNNLTKKMVLKFPHEEVVKSSSNHFKTPYLIFILFTMVCLRATNKNLSCVKLSLILGSFQKYLFGTLGVTASLLFNFISKPKVLY